MASSFGQYSSGIAPIQGISEAGANIGRTYERGMSALTESLAQGIKAYSDANQEREMHIEEIGGLTTQAGQLLEYAKTNPEYQPFVDEEGGKLAETLGKMKDAPNMSLGKLRGMVSQAKVNFSNFGQKLQMFTAMKSENEKNAILNAQGQAAGATTTVDDTVKTRASQFDPLKPYATQEVGFIDNLKKLQKQYPNAQIDVPSRLEEWRNNVSAQASELAKSNPLGLKVVDQVEAARKIDTATSPDVEGYNEAQQAVTNPAYTPTAEDLKALTAATGNQVTAQNITPELAAGVQKANSIAEGLNFNANPVTREKTIVDLLKKTLGFSLPALGAVGQAMQQTLFPNNKGWYESQLLKGTDMKKQTAGVTPEQLQQYRQPSVGDLVSTASKMGYPAYAALGLGANALMAGGSSVSAQAQPSMEQPAEQAQVQPTAQQLAMPAQRPANVPTIAVPEMRVGTVPREVPLDEVQKKQKTLEIFSKILKYGVDENGKQIIAPQAERMYQTMKPEEPKVYNLRDADGNIVSGTMNAKGDFKQFTSTGKTKSEGSLKLEKASTFGVVDPKTGQIGYEQPIQGLNVLVRGQGDFATTEKAEKFKELLASSAIVIKSMNRVKQIVKDDPYWAKTPFTVTRKEIISEQSKAIAMLQKSLGLDRLSDKDLKIIMERMPRGEDWYDSTPEQTTFMANQIIKDTHNLIKSSGEVHNLEIVLPDSLESTSATDKDFRLIDARNAINGIPAKK